MKYKRILFFAFFFALALFVVFRAAAVLLPGLWSAVTSGDEAGIEAYLAGTDKYSAVVYLGILQFIQVISIFIPTAPIQIAGGMVCGALRAYLVCQITYALANAVVFVAVRRFSGLTELVGESSHARVQKALRLINQGDPFVTVMLLCLIPLIPNGFIPYVASQTELRLRRFVGAVLLGSCYPIASMVLAGKFLVSGDYIVSALLIILNLTVLAIVYKKRDKISDRMAKRSKGRRGP